MSSYAEFLRESSKPLTDDAQEEAVFPVTVPHSRPRGTWGQWMKEITIPQDALDSLVRRYDSKSWSATGGRSSNLPSDGSARTAPAAGAWLKKPTLQPDRIEPRDVSKEGGAMRGVAGGAKRPKSSGRARALRLRAESSLDYQRPGVVGLPSYGSLPCWNFTCTLCKKSQFHAPKLTSLIAFQTSLLWLVSWSDPHLHSR